MISSSLNRFFHCFTAYKTYCGLGPVKRSILRVMRRMIGRITLIMRRMLGGLGGFGAILQGF